MKIYGEAQQQTADCWSIIIKLKDVNKVWSSKAKKFLVKSKICETCTALIVLTHIQYVPDSCWFWLLGFISPHHHSWIPTESIIK